MGLNKLGLTNNFNGPGHNASGPGRAGPGKLGPCTPLLHSRFKLGSLQTEEVSAASQNIPLEFVTVYKYNSTDNDLQLMTNIKYYGMDSTIYHLTSNTTEWMHVTLLSK